MMRTWSLRTRGRIILAAVSATSDFLVLMIVAVVLAVSVVRLGGHHVKADESRISRPSAPGVSVTSSGITCSDTYVEATPNTGVVLKPGYAYRLGADGLVDAYAHTCVASERVRVSR